MPTPVPLIQTLPGGLGTDEIDDVVVEELLGMVVDELLVEIGALLVVVDEEVELETRDVVLLDAGGDLPLPFSVARNRIYFVRFVRDRTKRKRCHSAEVTFRLQIWIEYAAEHPGHFPFAVDQL